MPLKRNDGAHSLSKSGKALGFYCDEEPSILKESELLRAEHGLIYPKAAPLFCQE
jgi:hypothetical protein